MSLIKTVPHQKFSLWQSCVSEVLHQQPETKELSLHAQRVHAVLQHPVMEAVTRHVTTAYERSAGLDPMEMGHEALEDLDDAAFASHLHFQIAEAKFRGDDEAVKRLGTIHIGRKYNEFDTGWLECIERYLYYKDILGEKEPLYRDWETLGKDKQSYGVIDYKLPANGKVALIADWGTGMADAKGMLEQVSALEPDALIHLGDIYYSGTPKESQANVHEIYNEVFSGDKPPIFLSIPGNHDYYSYGHGFYPLIDGANSDASKKQEASYFCLRSEDDKWQILGMDTGRQSYDPFKIMSPPGLQDSEILWHLDKLDKANFSGQTILMSHHQLFSQNNKISSGATPWANDKLMNVFQPYFDRIAAWFWGHEHNLALFEDGVMGLEKGRLIGCGAYEERTGQSPYNPHSPEFAAAVPYKQPPVKLSHEGGYYDHGYVIIDFSVSPPVVDYYQFPSWGTKGPSKSPAIDKIASEVLNTPSG